MNLNVGPYSRLRPGTQAPRAVALLRMLADTPRTCRLLCSGWRRRHFVRRRRHILRDRWWRRRCSVDQPCSWLSICSNHQCCCHQRSRSLHRVRRLSRYRSALRVESWPSNRWPSPAISCPEKVSPADDCNRTAAATNRQRAAGLGPSVAVQSALTKAVDCRKYCTDLRRGSGSVE